MDNQIGNPMDKMNCSGKGGFCYCLKHLILAILAICLIIYVSLLAKNAWRSYDYIGKTPDVVDRITVTGEGKVTAVPDVAIISLGIISEGASVSVATKDNTDKMNKIIDAIKNQFKIDPQDITTSNYNVSPKYDWSNNTQRIMGYMVSQSVSVKVRDFNKTGDLLGQATALGANNVSGPQFTIDDPEKFRSQARALAITSAKAKAKVLADQVGIKLGRIVNFTEGGANNIVPMYGYAAGLGAAEIKAVPSPVIESGSQDVVVDVSIGYEIR